MKYVVLCIAIALLLPRGAYAEVRITEIAWMGTTESTYGEWFELYNNGSSSVDLSGWQLYKDSGNKILFTLTKTIGAGEYLVVERTTPSMPDPVPGVNDEAGSFSNSGFNNTGEALVLKDGLGTTMQTLSYASGWPAGDATTKQTMQWDGSSWVTLAATPKSGVAGQAPVQAQQQDTGSTQQQNTSQEKSAPASSSATETIVLQHIPAHIEFNFPSTVHTGIGYDFAADVIYDDMHKEHGYFVWNMGDGSVLADEKIIGIHHTYMYPGTYVVSFAYYNTKKDAVPLLQSTQSVRVSDAGIRITQSAPTTITLHNDTAAAVDISQWKIAGIEGTLTLPDMTFIAPKASMTLPIARLGYGVFTAQQIYSPEGQLIAAIASATPATRSVSRTNTSVRNASISTTKSAEMTEVVQDQSIETIAPLQTNRRTKVVLGAALIVGIGLLLLLLGRFTAQRE